MIEFNASKPLTIGTEVEIQLIDRETGDLIPLAPIIIEQLSDDKLKHHIHPEMTKSMLEINSSVHVSSAELKKELIEIRDYVLTKTKNLNIDVIGGGTHPFQLWQDREIYPNAYFKKVSTKYGYLAKMFTVFGLHIHIGCPSGDDAIYLTNGFAHFMPHFVALSASSPFCQGVDTEFNSSRTNVTASFPLSGRAYYAKDWRGFSEYITQLQSLGIVEIIDNFYWDIRPRPDLGTIEIRVCDAPLTIDHLVNLVAYAQTIAKYLLEERPSLYNLDNQKYYKFNLFQACKNGLQAYCVNPAQTQKVLLSELILETLQIIEKHSYELGNELFLKNLVTMVEKNQNDAVWLRQLAKDGQTLKDIVLIQSLLWAGKIKQNNFELLSI